MYNNEKQPNYLLMAFILAELIYLLIIGSILSNLFISDNITADFAALPTASITNLPSFISRTESDSIRRSLYQLMLQNTDSKQLSNQNTSAIINTDTETSYHLSNKEFTFFSAIIDVPNLSQSYKLFYGYPDDSSNSFQQFFEILCVYSSNSSCISSSDITEIDIAHSYLPYVNFDNFTIFFRQNEPETININPMLPLDSNKNLETAYINQVKTAVQSLGLSPDSFNYHVLTTADYTYNIND